MTDFLDTLEKQLVEAAERHASSQNVARTRGRRGSSVRPVATSMLPWLATAVIALVAAGALRDGAPVHEAGRPSPTAGIDISRGDRSSLPPLAPVGGLSRGMRIAHVPTADFEVLDAWPLVVRFADGRAAAVSTAAGLIR
jgi:hypothetical protein